ncbi:NAD-dependent epimerase/dehydratase family protein [bacterium]|nr:NAD-dependent epimerase/dehydratase family protein [bacterium]
MKKVLVTGATGFIGHHLVRMLVEKGYYVCVTVRESSDVSRLPVEKVKLLHRDISSYHRADDADDYNLIFHIAGAVKARRRQDFFYVNTEGTARILEFAKRQKRLIRFVFLSSLAAAGRSPHGVIIDEKFPPHPKSWYGKSKKAAEEIVKSSGVPYTIIRPPTVYGPGDRELLPLFRAAYKGYPLCFGSKKKRVSLVYVDDLVRGVMLSAEHPDGENEVFFLTDGEPHSYGEFASAFEKATGKTSHPIVVPMPVLFSYAALNELIKIFIGRAMTLDIQKYPEFVGEWLCSSDKAQKLLGYTPRVQLVDGIRMTVDWYKQKGWL